MPVSADDLAKLQKTSLDLYLKNAPVSQITKAMPFSNRLFQTKKPFGGAKEYIIETLRTTDDSNFRWSYGDAKMTFKPRHTNELSEFPWRRCEDSLMRTDDYLFHNGIRVVRGNEGKVKLQADEKVQLVNLVNEDMTVLRDGFFRKLNESILRDGTDNADAIVGLDGIVTLTPETGTLGNIDRAKNEYWRNHADKTLTTANMVDQMEKAWRKCVTYSGGSFPDFILAGSDFIDAYRKSINIVHNANAGEVKRIDASTGSGTKTGLFFKGCEIIWDPTFDALDAADAPEVKWAKRCYFLNMKHITWREDGYDLWNPVAPHDTLATFTAVTMRCALTTNQANTHAVLALA